jgi:hypothetical protein
LWPQSLNLVSSLIPKTAIAVTTFDRQMIIPKEMLTSRRSILKLVK